MSWRSWAATTLVALVAGCAAVPADQPDLHAALAPDDLRAAAGTMQLALETEPDGAGLSWRNPGSGHGGAVRPVATFVSDAGQFCRRYEETLEVGAETATFDQEACRDPNGHWGRH
jgi:surface antigen